MITRHMLEAMEESLLALGDAASTLDEVMSEPLHLIIQAVFNALQQARVDFIMQPLKTPQIEETSLCPLCEDHHATESIPDHLFTVFMTQEEDIERDDLICKTCHEDWSERYPEESPATMNDRRGWFPKYEHDEQTSLSIVLSEQWDDVLYEGAIEPDNKQQIDQDIRSSL